MADGLPPRPTPHNEVGPDSPKQGPIAASRRGFLVGSAATGIAISVARPARGASDIWEHIEFPNANPRISASLAPGVNATGETSVSPTHAGVIWTGDPSAQLQFRYETSAGWSDWIDVERWIDLDDESTGRRFSQLMGVVGATAFDVVVRSGNAYDVVVSAINGADNSHERTSGGLAAVAQDIIGPNIVTRAQWGANESLRDYGEPDPPDPNDPNPPPPEIPGPDFATIKRFVVHHTVGPNNDPNPKSTIRGIYVYHTQSRGWSDIGYNFLVDHTGVIYEGRWSREYGPGEQHTAENEDGLGVIGAHAFGYNTGSVGVAALGTYTSATPPAAQRSAIADVIGWKAARADVDPKGWTEGIANISGHRDVGQTACPGNRLHAHLGSIREEAWVRADAYASQGSSGVRGYWTVTAQGRIYHHGQAPSFSSVSNLVGSIVGAAATPSGNGLWLVGSNGAVYTRGDATSYGSMAGLPLNKPMVGIEATPSGAGYWLLGGDGGIFSFGDAEFYGSMGGQRLAEPVVGMATSPTGNGYWLVASDGGIFAFGDAEFLGSMGRTPLNQPVLDMTSDGPTGYRMVAADGGIFSFGARFYGSLYSWGLLVDNVSAMVATKAGSGYYILRNDGNITTFGTAPWWGETNTLPAGDTAVAIVLNQS